MPTSVVLPPSQELAVEALIGSGSYKTLSEILRAAVDDFVQSVPKEQRLAAAIWAYEHRKASLSQAAALAGLDHELMHRILVRERRFSGGVPAADLESETALLVRGLGAPAAGLRKATKKK